MFTVLDEFRNILHSPDLFIFWACHFGEQAYPSIFSDKAPYIEFPLKLTALLTNEKPGKWSRPALMLGPGGHLDTSMR